MKKIAAVAVAFLILLLCSCTQWEDASYVAYECPEELRLMNTDTMDSCGDILETLGLSKEDALRALSDGRMFFTSFFPQTDGEGNVTYPVEMFLCVDTSDFVQNIFNFNRLSEEDLRYNLDLMEDTTSVDQDQYSVSDVSEVESNGVLYIKFDYTSEIDGETRYVTQYTTVYNGFVYHLFCTSSVEITEEIAAARDELFSSIRFTQTLEAEDPYDPDYRLFSHTVSRFFKKNLVAVIVIAVITVGLTVFGLIYSEKRKKSDPNKPGKKKDGIVRADYLK